MAHNSCLTPLSKKFQSELVVQKVQTPTRNSNTESQNRA